MALAQHINLKIYPRDTLISIKNRLAATIDSSVEYTVILSPDPLDLKLLHRQDSSEFLVVDIIRVLKTHKNFDALYENAEFANMLRTKKIKLEESVLIWLFYNLDIDANDYQDLIVQDKLDKLNSRMSTKIPDITGYATKKAEFIEKLDRGIKDARVQTEEFNRHIQAEENIEGVMYTEFEKEKVEYEITTDVTNMTILDVFDSIELNDDVVFANLDKYYKILKNSTPSIDWAFDSDEFIKLVLSKYKDLDLFLTVNNNTLIILCTLDNKSFTIQQLADIVLNILKSISPKIKTIVQKSVNGVFYIPNQSINTNVFSHLVMNDINFSTYLVIDEFKKATKTKDGVYTYYDSGLEIMSIIITSKEMSTIDPTMRGKDKILFPDGKPYLRIKISRSEKIESIQQFQKFISKMITLYNEKSNSIIKIYKELGCDVIEKRKGKKSKRADSGDATGIITDGYKTFDPDLFSSIYTRTCNPQPSIIPESQIKKYTNVIKFPKTPEEGIQRYYTCQHEKVEGQTQEKQFIGLQPLRNNPKYNFVPCCFKDSQYLKKSSDYVKYYHPEEWKPPRKVQQKIIDTNKILDYKTIGNLTPFTKIYDFFYSYETGGVKYYRHGVDRSKMSFLQCVMTALEYKFAEKIDVVAQVLKEICRSNSLLAPARQQFPDKRVNEIKELLLNDDTYINPKLYIGILENFFKCKIFVFSKESLQIPYHVKNLLSHAEKGRPMILILEHFGSESDNALYPQCELIARIVTGKSMDLKFVPSDKISIDMRQMFKKMSRSYILNKKVVPYEIEEELTKQTLVGQYINSFGKTYAIVVGSIIMYTDIPIAPLITGESVKYNIYSRRVTIDQLNTIFAGKEILISDIYNNTISGLKIETYAGNIYYVPVESEVSSPYVTPNILMPRSGNSKLDVYNKYKKTAEYLSWYIIHLFSMYVNSKNIAEMNDDAIENFIRDIVKIDASETYENLPFSMRFDPGFLSSGKLPVQNQDMLARLVYVLKLEIARNPKKVIDSYKHKNIQNKIVNISDFQQYPRQLILEGKDYLIKYMDERNLVFVLGKTVSEKSTVPYFTLVEQTVFLAENVDTLEKAKSIQYNWEKFHYNSAEPLRDNKHVSLYKFDGNSLDHVAGNKDYPKIVGYKMGKDVYTPLMNL